MTTKVTRNMLNTSIDDNGNSTALTISSDENLGIGTTTVTNNTLGTATYFGNSTSSIVGDNTSGNSRFWLSNNWYYNSGDKYIINDEATIYTQQNGEHQFLTAPSGSANSAISFSTGLKIDNAGHVTKPLQPYFHAYRSSDQTNYNPTSLGEPVLFNAEILDINGDFNTSTGLFTAPVDGTYWFIGSAYSSTNNWQQVWLAINTGAGAARATYTDVVISLRSVVNGVFYVHLDANDTVGLHPYTGASSSVTVNSSANHTWFKGGLLY